jgi:uncharacterized repeat protein (TIGR03943 family)
MQAKVSNALNACTLVGLGAVFLSFYWSGRIDQYLNPLFRPLVLVSGVVTVIIGVTRLLGSHPAQHRCSERDCDHRHVRSVLWSLASFGVICVSVLAGSTFSRDAFDQQIVTNRGSIEDDGSLSGLHISNAGSPGNALHPFVSKNGSAFNQDMQSLPAPGTSDAGSMRGPANGEIALEVTDLLRAEEPLRNALAVKNVAVVGQFVRGSTETKFRLTRMLIWCCAADARPIHVTVEVSAPVNFPDMQWVKVVGKPEYSIRNGHAHLVMKADRVMPVKPPKEAMLY